jgi:hypothetical protein
MQLLQVECRHGASLLPFLLAGTRPVWNETLRFNGADYANEAIITVSNARTCILKCI